MKTLLINPFYIVPRSWMPGGNAGEPLALEYLAAVTATDHKLRILDCIGEFPYQYKALPNNMFHMGASLEQIRAIISEWRPDLVGVTSPFTTQVSAVYSIMDLVKEIDKSIITVVGGCTVSCYPIQTLEENQNIDIVVVGEGELTFKELLDREAESLDEIDGIVYRNGYQIIRNSSRQFIENLDEIPFPRRDLIPFEYYSMSRILADAPMHRERIKIITNWLRFGKHRTKTLFNKVYKSLSGHDFLAPPLGLSYGPRANILTSRGCPFNCSFCAIRNVWGHTYRMRSAENVLDEITLLYEKHNVRHFGIEDDNFNVSKKRTIAICKGIVDRGLNVTFRADSGVYLSTCDEGTLSIMKRAGFHELYFGIESGNQEILKTVIDKKINLKQVKEVERVCKKLGIVSGGFFMVGVPGETKETMEETVKFAIDSELDRIRIYTYQPFPGSKLYDDCKKNRWIPDDFDDSKALIFDSKAYVQTKDFFAEDVTEIAEKGRAVLRNQGRLDM